MKLRSVPMRNFRGFDDVTIDFNEKLTVLIGEKGAGKSSAWAASESVPDNDSMNFVCAYIAPQAGTLHRFFTTARLFFSAKAEDVLREAAQSARQSIGRGLS